GPPAEGRRPPVPRSRRALASAPILRAARRPRFAEREGVLCRRSRCRRRVGSRSGAFQGDRVHSHRSRRARARRGSERQGALRREPQRGKRVGDLVPHAQGRREVAHPRRRQSGHGGRLCGREGALAVRTLQLGGVRDRHADGKADRAHPGRCKPARPLCLAAAGKVLPRPYGQHALMRMLWVSPRADLLGPAVAAGLLAALLDWLGPPGTDLAAHVYQRTLFIEHGFVLWNNFWYAGRYSFVNYSVLYYPLAAAIGIKLLAVLTVAVAVVAFAAVVRHEWESHSRWAIRVFALVWALLVVSSSYRFMLGMTLALSALWSLQQDRRWVFAGFTVLTLAASPLAFLLLVVVLAGVALGRRGEHGRVVAAAASIGALAPF